MESQKETRRFKYKVKTKDGILEPWTGSWHTREEADAWYSKHGLFFENRGHELVLFDSLKDLDLAIAKED